MEIHPKGTLGGYEGGCSGSKSESSVIRDEAEGSSKIVAEATPISV